MDERTRSDAGERKGDHAGQHAGSPAVEEAATPLARRLADVLRARLIAGELKPGQRVSEAALAASLEVSRNTLREVFRLLTMEGLLRHEPNRGVFVATPSMGSIIDIYRVRRVIEGRAIAGAPVKHPAVEAMRGAVELAEGCRAARDWRGVGSANMRFHTAIVELADSPRLNVFYAQVAAELRLCFGLIADQEFLHDPYIDLNAAILREVEAGRMEAAAGLLADYLLQSERMLLAAFGRLSAGAA